MIEKNKKVDTLRAILGPTNTGKTYYAMDRMLSHKSGMIGFPLRLLARENYEKAVKIVGKHKVALITGEEKIIPKNAIFFCCTVEAMPMEKKVAFLSVDEIQLIADHERGHIFTDRLLNARGFEETIFLGSEIVKHILKIIVPNCKIETRPRLSNLTYAGVKKITKLDPRSAVVAFSIPEVYKIAELVRTQKGGAAVVMGALSPRTRNSQVDLYQNGQVDYLIATDAIGMGLNLDIDHVAFASKTKFDGKSIRNLDPVEIAQIAGRAGRSSKNGTFGVINDGLKVEKRIVEMIENHDFSPLKNIWWRNSALIFSSLKDLVYSLESSPSSNLMRKKGNALDFISLINMSKLDLVRKNESNEKVIRLLWDVCQIPDFGNSFSDKHFDLLQNLFSFLLKGKIDNDWIKKQINSLNKIDGDIDTLLSRISNIRTWSYITNKNQWIFEPEFWQNEAKSIEEKLSDALHERLTKRFVDKKIVALQRGLSKNLPLDTIIKFDGMVLVEGQEVGILKSFDFSPKLSNVENSSRILMAARKALPKELEKRVKEFVNCSEDAIKLDQNGNILWIDNSIGKLAKGNNIYNPKIILNDFQMLSEAQKKKVENKCGLSLKSIILKTLGQSINLKNPKISKGHLQEEKSEINTKDEDNVSDFNLLISSRVKAIAFHVYEGLGSVSVNKIPFSLQNLNQDEKRSLAKLRLRLGTSSVYIPELLKPVAIGLRSLLWSVYYNQFPKNGAPASGRVSCEIDKNILIDYYNYIGYSPFINIAVRIDILERLLVILRNESKKIRFRINEMMLSITGATKDQMKEIIENLNYKMVEEIKSDQNEEILIPLFEKKKSNKRVQNINKRNKIKNKKSQNFKENLESPFQILKTLKF